MSHQDQYARGVRFNSADLFKALQWLTAGVDWSAIQMRKQSTWTPQWLTWTAILWAWSNEYPKVMLPHDATCEESSIM